MTLPLIADPEALVQRLGDRQLVVVDVGKQALYNQAHIPGARFLDYGLLVASSGKTHGLLPDRPHLERLLSSLGIDNETHVVACDDEGGGKAARLLWTLECAGHRRMSLLNGGLHAWANEGHPHDSTPVTPVAADFTVEHNNAPCADSRYIMQYLNDPDVGLLDVRSPEEFSGIKKFASRGGHIPGAVNMDWTRAMDQQRNLRFRPDEELQHMLADIGITPGREIITYCQTHHRSAHTYIVLRHLGFPKVRGYHGSWSDWGNNPELPVE